MLNPYLVCFGHGFVVVGKCFVWDLCVHVVIVFGLQFVRVSYHARTSQVNMCMGTRFVLDVFPAFGHSVSLHHSCQQWCDDAALKNPKADVQVCSVLRIWVLI